MVYLGSYGPGFGQFWAYFGGTVLDLAYFGPISRVLGLNSDPFQPIVEAYPGGYLNGLTRFWPGSCETAIGPFWEFWA